MSHFSVQASPLSWELLEQGAGLIPGQARTQPRASHQRGPKEPLHNKGKTVRARDGDTGPVKGLGAGVGGREGGVASLEFPWPSQSFPLGLVQWGHP